MRWKDRAVLLGPIVAAAGSSHVVRRSWLDNRRGAPDRVGEGLHSFARVAGLAKLVLNFSTEILLDGRTRLATETRVQCVDRTAQRQFTPYWWVIRPREGSVRMASAGH